MTSSDDWRKTVRLNKLLGMWAAEKLGITGRDAEAYSDALAVGTAAWRLGAGRARKEDPVSAAENWTGPATAQHVRTGPRDADPQLLPIPPIIEKFGSVLHAA